MFLAERDGRPVGFVQLYPVFSSTAARPRRLWLLNDLFVAPEARGGGVARALMQRARRLAEETDAVGLELATAHANTRPSGSTSRSAGAATRISRGTSSRSES